MLGSSQSYIETALIYMMIISCGQLTSHCMHASINGHNFSLVFLNAQHATAYTKQRKPSIRVLKRCIAFQEIISCSSIPALQDSQLKHRTFRSLSHALQSGLEEALLLFFFHTIGFSQLNPHSTDGLQQLDCKST